jgi:hypothetical protein
MNRFSNLLEPPANFKGKISHHSLSIVLVILFLTLAPSLGYSASGASLTLSSTKLSFASYTVGAASAPLQVTVASAGRTALAINSLTFAGTDPKDFSETSNCPASLPKGTTCTIEVVFTPAAAGARSAVLEMGDNAARSPQKITLSGAGVSSAAAASVSTSSLSFGSQAVGSASATQSVVLSNSGNAALSVTGISISGTSAADFAQSNNCASSVAAGSSCTVSVTFTPAVAGSLAASLSIANSVSNQTVTLSGTGTSASASVTLSPGSLSFSSEPVTLSSATQTVTLSNSGSATLSIAGFTVTGTNAADFTQNNNCPASLAAGSSCSIVVLFTPSASGSRSASISIADNAGSSQQSIALSGTGAHDVVLTWTASTSSAVTGYNVYRGTVTGGEGTTPINASPVAGTGFTDSAVAAGTEYFYTVTAVASSGSAQSASSSEAAAQVPTP